MKNDKIILIFLADIVSHYIPTFFFARKLQNFNFKIVFVGNSLNTKKIAEDNGFEYIQILPTETKNVNSNTIGFKVLIKEILRDRVYRDRRISLKDILSKTKPSFILIDIFASETFIHLSELAPQIKKFFVCPMLSTYSISGMPSIRDYDWKQTTVKGNNKYQRSFSYSFFKVHMANKCIFALNKVFSWIHCYKAGLLFGKNSIAWDNKMLLTFRNVPEFVLAPESLELSANVRKSHQVYLGLSLDFSRKDYPMKEDDRAKFLNTLTAKRINHNIKIVYVSFGTYFSSAEEYFRVSNFILALSECAKYLTDVIFLVAANAKIREVVSGMLSMDRFHIMDQVPQLEVLQNADVFLTHGGLSSVKEAIHYRVPMLIYPLDKFWDQNGNSLKIVHHGLGLRGDMDWDDTSDILEKLNILLKDNNIKENLRNFAKKIEISYSDNFYNEVINHYFSETGVNETFSYDFLD